MNQTRDRANTEIEALVSSITRDLQSLVEKIVVSKLESLSLPTTPNTNIENTPAVTAYTTSPQPSTSLDRSSTIPSIAQQQSIGTPFSPNASSLEQTNKSFQKYLQLAQECKQQKNYSEALLNYDRAIQLNPNSAEAYYSRARLKHYKLGDYPGSLSDYDRAIELNPTQAEFYCNRAYLYQYTYQNYSAALADYDRAIELNPNWSVAIEYRAKLLVEQQAIYSIPVSLPCVEQYNDRALNFAEIHKTIDIVRDEENYNQSRTGHTEDIILTTTNNRGSYWLFKYEDISYLVPTHKLKIREEILDEVKQLFDCENYQEHYYNTFVLVKPAIVTHQADGKWKLKNQGMIQFG
jgi:tetratricopeptide (TPR) repeat protein